MALVVEGGMEKEPITFANEQLDTEHQDVKDESSDAAVGTNSQPGVQQIEAVTLAWTKTALIVAYAMIWVIYFVEGVLAPATAALNPYVTSAFAEHSLTPVVGIISTIVGGVMNLTLAKVLDVFGRPQGFVLCICIATIGLIMMAACSNVEAYAAAQIFYTVGNNGLQYALSVFVADTSKLRNRGLMTALVASPNMVTCWLGGPVSTAFLNGPGWRWCFGAFSIIVPAFTSPLAMLFLYNYHKAKKQGLVPQRSSGRTPLQSTVYYLREFDAVGILLLSAGVAMFLLPFNLYTLQEKGWHAPLIICLLVFGILLIIIFAIWEKYFAPVTFIPYSLLLDRTVLGACILSAVLFMSYYCWVSYFSSFLQVVNNLSVTHASYVIQIYTIGGVIFSIVTGAFIHYTGHFKHLTLFFGIPMSIFGLGLMIYFSRPNGNVGYIIMCQILMSAAEGVVVICDEIAALAAASHQHIAVVIAILGVFSGIGGAIGLTIASAIWQGVFPAKLAEYLPVDDLPNLLMIYGDLTTQLSYPVGTPTRLAIQLAYGDAQKMMLIAGTAVWVLGVVSVLMWRNIGVIGIDQVKGHVF